MVSQRIRAIYSTVAQPITAGFLLSSVAMRILVCTSNDAAAPKLQAQDMVRDWRTGVGKTQEFAIVTCKVGPGAQ